MGKIKRVLCCNQVFLDYRIPYFKELIRLFEGDYYVMFSPNRYHLMHRDDLVKRIYRELGENAVSFKHDYLFDTATMSFTKVNGERGQKIPFIFGLLTAIHRIKPDVLISEAFFQWTPWCVLYHLIFRKPLYIEYERTMHTERYTGKLKTWYRRWTDKFVEGYLVNGTETKKYLMSIGVKEQKIHCVGMCADSDGLKSAVANFKSSEQYLPFRSEFHHKDGLTYLFSGQLVERKGTKYLLNAWKRHIASYPDDCLVLCGSGDLEKVLRTQFESIQGVQFEGKVPYDEMHKYYAAADVFILPTLEDNWSLVVPEAMACGLPVATSIYNGCHSELIQEGKNGFTFDPLDQDSLVQVLAAFHEQDLKSMGEISSSLEENFNTTHCAQRAFDCLSK